MKSKKYKYDYANINVKAEVAKRFRAFSKKVARSHAETLTAMMDFFDWHGYTPHQRFGKDVIAGQKKNRKRIEAGIAISKSIEKAQNIPLTNIETMLRALFEEESKKYDPKLIESKTVATSKPKTDKKETTVSRIEYDWTNRKLMETEDRMRYLLGKIEPVKNRFGKDYLRINIDRGQLARYKRALKNK